MAGRDVLDRWLETFGASVTTGPDVEDMLTGKTSTNKGRLFSI
jgi:hypothetical protein